MYSLYLLSRHNFLTSLGVVIIRVVCIALFGTATVFKLLVSRHLEDCLDVEVRAKELLVGRLADHSAACFVVGLPVLDHVGALVDSLVPIDLEVVDKQKHQALVVEEVLQALK